VSKTHWATSVVSVCNDVFSVGWLQTLRTNPDFLGMDGVSNNLDGSSACRNVSRCRRLRHRSKASWQMVAAVADPV